MKNISLLFVLSILISCSVKHSYHFQQTNQSVLPEYQSASLDSVVFQSEIKGGKLLKYDQEKITSVSNYFNAETKYDTGKVQVIIKKDSLESAMSFNSRSMQLEDTLAKAKYFKYRKVESSHKKIFWANPLVIYLLILGIVDLSWIGVLFCLFLLFLIFRNLYLIRYSDHSEKRQKVTKKFKKLWIILIISFILSYLLFLLLDNIIWFWFGDLFY